MVKQHTIFSNRQLTFSSAKNNSINMGKFESHTLSDNVLYDDMSLYVAKEGEKLYFHFKRKPYYTETYNILEAVSILIQNSQWQNLPIWDIELSELDREVNFKNACLYWLCNIEQVENEFNMDIDWNKCCEKITIQNKERLIDIIQNSKTLDDVRKQIYCHLNFDYLYSQLLKYSS